MAGFSVDVKGAEEVSRTMNKGLKNDIAKRVKTLAINVEIEVKKATVVDTGLLRSSMTRGSPTPLSARIGTMTEYGEYIEDGTQYMEARHMEGGSKVLGEGMMAYTLRKMAKLIKEFGVSVCRDAKAKGA